MDAITPSTWHVNRRTYDAHGTTTVPGTLVRSEGQGATADIAVDAAHDNAKIVFDFYRDVLGRNGIQGTGAPMLSIAHAVFAIDDTGRTTANNAAWSDGRMAYGDGDGTTFGQFSRGLDVVGHELTHGVTEATAGLEYAGQSGALNESWSDVMGELVQLWHEDPATFADPAAARNHTWVGGEDIYTPGVAGDAFRSLAQPGTSHPGDDQPATMRDYADLPIDDAHDWGGVHTNSGIPNKAAYEAGIKIGGDKLAKVWYRALTSHLGARSDFADAARATVDAARELYTDPAISQAVRDAWAAVGVFPDQHTHVAAPVTSSLTAPSNTGYATV
jgi:Zn-dependent metalloprotease